VDERRRDTVVAGEPELGFRRLAAANRFRARRLGDRRFLFFDRQRWQQFGQLEGLLDLRGRALRPVLHASGKSVGCDHRLRKLACAAVTLLLRLAQRLVHDPIERPRAVRVDAVRWRRRVVHDPHQDPGDVRRFECDLVREHLVQDCAERENVRALIDVGAAHCLLRRHVERRADSRADRGQLGAHVDLQLDRAEVEHTHVVSLGCATEKDVVRLEIAVNDAERVGVLERQGNLAHDPHDACRSQHLSVTQNLAELLALQILHREEVGAIGRVAEFQHFDDVGMLQLERAFELTLEALDRDSIARDVRVQNLDRDPRLGLGMAPLEHPAHGSIGHAGHRDVAPELLAQPGVGVRRILILDRDRAVLPAEEHGIRVGPITTGTASRHDPPCYRTPTSRATSRRVTSALASRRRPDRERA
jgi:hypothetical protein